MKYICVAILLISTASWSQPLRDINYRYLYDPASPVSVQLRAVRGESSYTLLYQLEVKDTTGLLNQYSLEWEARSLLSDKEGMPVTLQDLIVSRSGRGLQGRGTIAMSGAARYIVAKVTDNSTRRAWLFYTTLEPNYPANNFLLRNGFIVSEPYIRGNEPVKLGVDSGEWIVSYYDDDFPAAAPVFSEALARVSRTMAVDSVFTVTSDEELSFPLKGLYLVQKDTNAIEGLAFRSEDDYPQYSKLANLAGPLIYITTRQEYDKLEAAQGSKKAFDRTILSIVSDVQRASTLMRNYFRRVELANRYFTSYKEGWKSDRGMVYIVFGMPDEVYRFDDREIWRYNNNRIDIDLTFSRSTSLFDPDNFVLIREKKYENTWYEVIDLWRNARF